MNDALIFCQLHWFIEPPSATPKILGPVQNYTFKTDDSATVIARIKCACDEPVIQVSHYYYQLVTQLLYYYINFIILFIKNSKES